MTATDELRRLLDERGVEWVDQFGPFPVTAYETNDVVWVAKEYRVGVFSIETRPVTPEQAIAATLGRGECKNVSYRVDESRFHCSECGFGCWVKDVSDGRDKLPNYCPNCGRVVDE